MSDWQKPLNSDGDTLASLTDELANATAKDLFGMPIVQLTMSAANRDHIVRALRMLAAVPAAPVADDAETVERLRTKCDNLLRELRERNDMHAMIVKRLEMQIVNMAENAGNVLSAASPARTDDRLGKLERE